MSAPAALEMPAGVVEELGAMVGVSLLGDRDGRGLRIGMGGAAFNGGITARLVRGALEGLAACGVDLRDVTLAWVPGAFELPLVARAFATGGSVDAVVCLGAVIRGETGHYDLVAGQCAAGLQRVQLDTAVPVVFGVLATDTAEQALARSAPGDANKGREAALTAVEMARLLGGGPLRAAGLGAPGGS